MPVTLNPIAEKLKQLFGRDDSVLREALRALTPEELASVIDGVPPKRRMRIVHLAPDEKLAQAMTHVAPQTAKDLFPQLAQEKVLSLVGCLESDDSADLIQMLDGKKKERIIAALRRSDPKRVLPLLGYEEDTAGGLMRSELLRGEREKTVDEVRRSMPASRIAVAASLFVVEADGRLVGKVPLVRMASASGDRKLGDIMLKDPVSVPVTMPQEDVVNIFEEHDLLELPVVDGRGKLLGVITADDVLDVVQEEFSEDLSRFVGVSENERITDPALVAVRQRLPWLMINLVTSGIAAWIVSRFEPSISRFALLAALMPVVAGLGGNSALQTLSVTVRAIALGELHSWGTLGVLWRQFVVGLTTGFAIGSIMATIVWRLTGNTMLAFVVLAAMLFNILLGAIIGVAVPVLLHRLRFDPALASSVFLTATTDAMGFLAFLGLASHFLF